MAEYIIDKIEYGGNVYKLQDSVSDFLTGAVTALSTTEGQHSTITNQNGAVSIAIPTKTSHLTNDSGFITSFTDENVKNTAVTAATTYYLTGSTSSSTITGGLSKHAAIKAYVTANSGTGGSARIDLGNTTATTSAGGKEGVIRLYGTSATYYVELKAGAPSANRTISFPNKAGTVALTDDIPTVSYPVTSVNNKTGAVSLSASDVGALPSTTAIPSKTSDLTNDSGYVTSSGVTSVATGAGLTGGTITGTGTLKANLTSDTALSNAALSVTEDANRIYPVRIDKNNKLVVVVPWTNVNSSYLTGITSSQVTTALGFTPYNATNPSGYTSNVGTVTQVTAGTGLSIGTTAQGNFTTTGIINHTNSITAGTAGTSSATSGATLAVPYITYDAQGHITATGTHTHTISGFLTSSSTLDATKLSGTIPSGCYTNTVTTATTTGSGNAVTAVTASNGALTITKGTNFQPAVTYSTTDLTAGSSSLTTGQIYLVYE